MKIMFTIGSLAGGGAERVVSRLASGMAARGDSVEIALIATDTVDYSLDERVVVKAISPKLQIRGLRYLLRCLEYRKEVGRFRPDVIISFTTAVNLFVLDAMRGSSCKIILSERNDPYNDPKDAASRRKRDRLYRKASAFVFQTEDAKAYFSRDIQARSAVILNPVEVPSELILRPDKERKIVTVGRLEPQKDQATLIKAFSRIHQTAPAYKLEIYGEGSLRSQLEALIRAEELEDAVFLMGYRTDVLEQVSKASLFVLPSKYEGMSNALIEAMAVGVPVVSTDHPIGGARMVIEHGVNGMLVPVGDGDAIAQTVCQILNDEALFATLSRNAVRINERLDVERITDEWMEIVRSVVGKG